MNEAKRMREHARAALRMSESTKSEDGRASLRSVAKAWLRTAEQLERRAEQRNRNTVTSIIASRSV